ncbi:hypothetical protein CC85DRAFT_328864 [Cutaneotrichosporon oleaginosum]|uniref:Uncharacterized protein n=1 Tax=Cutaneotrichosporon oleaginosum TaxID=879819 RepID=A0A0J0XKH3_9TREE|nr:uncharacterized protein CC85DRAFT_328864 [Cutaneotrichosporon oleaginosum]KLT41601.1 hypothetical protein CC85DRAFT_328864 [Cutaneotrichosporon oleaginosum]TXT08160.1 hypothetical protein COLE_05084 [Cutaneotrichosporon oleaginosum]
MMSGDYDIPRASRIKLKSTAAEIASKIYDQERRRVEKERERVARANGLPYDRKRKRDDAARRRREYIDDMDEAFEDGGLFGDISFGSALPGFSSSSGLGGISGLFSSVFGDRTSHVRDVFEGPPPMGSMGPEAYRAYVREQFRTAQRAQDVEEDRRRGTARREAEEAAYRAQRIEEEREEREAKRRRRAHAEKAAREAQDAAAEAAALRREEGLEQRAERARWRKRCTALFDNEVVSVELGFADIPWPVAAAKGRGYSIVLNSEDLTTDNVRRFLFALADDEGGDRRKVLREAIRLFHSDRFHSRVLPRVKESERERVREGVEAIARVLTDLLSAT